MFTPWGPSHTQGTIAPGITWVSTASHGGYLVSGAAAEAIPPAARAVSYAGHPWYEEDCDWSIVVAFNQAAFKAEEVEAALHCVAQWHPELADETPCLCGAPQYAGRCTVPGCVASGA